MKNKLLEGKSLILAQEPFWLKTFKRTRFFFVLFCSLVRRRTMPRRGWTSYPTPSGWYEVIRGPRPKSVQWPKSSVRTAQVQQPPTKPVRFLPQRVSQTPEQRSEVAKQKVSGIEAALAALAAAGSTEGPEVTMLKEALQRARRSAQDRPLQEQLSQNEAFIERTRRRIAAIDEQKAQEVAELEKAQERRNRLLQEIASAVPPQAQDVGDPMEEVIRLRAKVAQLEAQFPTRGSEEAHQNLCARAAKRRAGVPCVEDVMPTSEQDIHEWMEVKNQELRGALDMGDMESVTCLTDMIPRGAKKIATAHRPPPSSVASMAM